MKNIFKENKELKEHIKELNFENTKIQNDIQEYYNRRIFELKQQIEDKTRENKIYTIIEEIENHILMEIKINRYEETEKLVDIYINLLKYMNT